jgi:plastocyanin
MRQIPLLPALFLGLSLPVLLSACATCPDYIEVTYAADGTPVVAPDSCKVKVGATVTWRGPESDDTPFTLRFDGDPGTVEKGRAPGGGRSMIATSASLEVVSEPGPHQEVTITAENVGAYKYDVEANNHTLDPHIIIEK